MLFKNLDRKSRKVIWAVTLAYVVVVMILIALARGTSTELALQEAARNSDQGAMMPAATNVDGPGCGLIPEDAAELASASATS